MIMITNRIRRHKITLLNAMYFIVTTKTYFSINQLTQLGITMLMMTLNTQYKSKKESSSTCKLEDAVTCKSSMKNNAFLNPADGPRFPLFLRANDANTCSYTGLLTN